jgi:hypothetical protein
MRYTNNPNDRIPPSTYITFMAIPPLQSLQRRNEPAGQQKKYRYDSQIDEIHVHTPSIDGKGNVVHISFSTYVDYKTQKVKMA